MSTVVAGIMITLLVLTGNQYRFFCAQAVTLVTLQDEYRAYIATLKNVLHNYYETHSDEDICCDFIPINRAPTYLWESTLDYFKANSLDGFTNLYEQFDIVVAQKPLKKDVSVSSDRIKKNQKKNKNTVHSRATSLYTLFSWPIERERFWFSSPFGPRRKKDGSRGFHYGIDMAALKGTSVMAAGSGVVTQAGYAAGFGNTVVIKHTNRFSTRYAHLDKIMVSKGKQVTNQTVIGLVGETGYIRKRTKDGSHLHFEVYDAGKPIDPLLTLPSLYV